METTAVISLSHHINSSLHTPVSITPTLTIISMTCIYVRYLVYISRVLYINTTTGEGATLPVEGDTDEVKTKPPIEGLSLSEPSPPSSDWSAAEREEPSLPKLLELDIPESVGAGYRKFGTFLLNDKTGSLVDAIEMECLGKPHHITTKILQEWVVGKGKVPTWQTLVQTLRRCKLTDLADQIEREVL